MPRRSGADDQASGWGGVMGAKLSQEDLLEMLKMQVHMVAETAAKIAVIRGKKTTLGLSAQVAGFDVAISITAERATQ